MADLTTILIYAGIGMLIATIFIFIICHDEGNEHHE